MDERYDRDYGYGGGYAGSQARGVGRDYGMRDTDYGRMNRGYEGRGERSDFGPRDYDREYEMDRGYSRGERDFDHRGYDDRDYGRGYDDRSRMRGRDYGRDERGRDSYSSGQYFYEGRDYGSPSRGMDYDRGRSGRGYDRGYGSTYDRGYGQGSYGGQSRGMGSYGRDRGYGPTGGTTYTYTEYWLIPGPQTGQGPEGYQRSSDRITEEVNERLTRHGELNATNIRVSADNGEVTLEGTVNSRRDKRMAEDAAESVSGVSDVHNRLTVRDETEDAGEDSSSSACGKRSDGKRSSSSGSSTSSNASAESNA